MKIILDKRIEFFFNEKREQFYDEKSALTSAVDIICLKGIKPSNKNIIEQLLIMLSTSKSIRMKDILRNTLEVIMLYTDDDL